MLTGINGDLLCIIYKFNSWTTFYHESNSNGRRMCAKSKSEIVVVQINTAIRVQTARANDHHHTTTTMVIIRMMALMWWWWKSGGRKVGRGKKRNRLDGRKRERQKNRGMNDKRIRQTTAYWWRYYLNWWRAFSNSTIGVSIFVYTHTSQQQWHVV